MLHIREGRPQEKGPPTRPPGRAVSQTGASRARKSQLFPLHLAFSGEHVRAPGKGPGAPEGLREDLSLCFLHGGATRLESGPQPAEDLAWPKQSQSDHLKTHRPQQSSRQDGLSWGCHSWGGLLGSPNLSNRTQHLHTAWPRTLEVSTHLAHLLARVKALFGENKYYWLPTPVFLPGEFHGHRTPTGLSSWDHKELERTEQLTLSLSSQPPTPGLRELAQSRHVTFQADMPGFDPVPKPSSPPCLPGWIANRCLQQTALTPTPPNSCLGPCSTVRLQMASDLTPANEWLNSEDA